MLYINKRYTVKGNLSVFTKDSVRQTLNINSVSACATKVSKPPVDDTLFGNKIYNCI